MLKITDNDPMPLPEAIPTPSLQWNNLLGGGLWTDRIHTLWGNPGGGKSTMALKILAEGQKMGYKPVIFDSEATMNADHMEKCGLDLSNKLYFSHANILEDIQKEALPLLRDGNKHIFLFDSINGIVRSDFFKDDEKHGGMALYARSQNELCTKLSGFLNPDNMVIFIAQQTVDVGNMASPTVGKFGNAVEHFSTNIIKIYGSASAKELEKNDDGSISSRTVLWTFTKSKQRPITGANGSYTFYPNDARIDNTDEIIDLGAKYGIIDNSSKGWFAFNGEKLRRSDLVDRLDAATIESILEQVAEANARG